MIFTLSGWFCAIVLTLTSLIHVYWGLGGLWPASDPAALSRTVVGVDAQQMPGLVLTLVIALLIFAAGAFGFVRGVLRWDSLLLIRIPLGVLTAIFTLRGAIAYLPGPFAQATEPFKTLNITYFSPLILALAVCFALLTFSPRD